MANKNVARDSSKTFKKGQSGNPKGRPKGSVSLVTRIKEILSQTASDGQTYEEKLSKAVILRAIAKSDVLAKELLDRTDGKVAQPIAGHDGGPLNINFDPIFNATSRETKTDSQ